MFRPVRKIRRAVALAICIMMISPPLFASGQDAGGELVLRVAMQDDMKGLNPLIVSDVWSWNVLSYIFDGPINIDPDTDEIIPYIAIGSANLSGKAESWADCAIGNFGYSPESTWHNQSKQEAIIFYDFTNVKWHDGIQMTVRDIMFSMHVAAQVPEWSSSMDPLKAWNFSSTGWLEVCKVWESAGKLQAALRFRIQEQFADFFTSTISTFLLPEHIWNSAVSGQKIWCDPDYVSNPWLVAFAQAYTNNPPIGSGPFKFVSWDMGQMIKISTWRDHFFREDYKYKAYVGADEYGRSYARQPEIDAVTYQIFKTAEAAVYALKSDDIDYIAWSVPPTYVQELANEPGVALEQHAEKGFFYMAYNMRHESFGYNETGADVGKPLRQAIAHCIDKKTIVNRLLLNLGVAGTGPIPPFNDWYNESVPTYDFDPDEAKQILANAGYKVEDHYSGILYEGDEALAKAGNGNWWVNPDGSPIGSSSHGLINILTKEANYDPISANEGSMIAQQLRNIGIYAQSNAQDYAQVIDRIEASDFDMYILGWSIGTEPSKYLYSFFHSSNADVGQNYPGYHNISFDSLIDLARRTEDPAVKEKAILDAQAAICYDLPYDVLYYRTNIEAYRSERFTGWVVGDKGSIFCWQSLYNIHAPGPWKVNAQFVSPPSAVQSNATVQITVYVRDQDSEPLEGARVYLNTSVGKLTNEEGVTTATGKFTTTFTAPWADPNDPDMCQNGTSALIQIVKATYISPVGTLYVQAPSRIALVKVFPQTAEFLSVTLTADPDIINPDIGEDGTPGFAYVEVSVTDHNQEPLAGASVALSDEMGVLLIEPTDQMTDAQGKARFKVTATDLPNNDSSEVQFALEAIAIHPTDVTIQGKNMITISIIDIWWDTWPPQPRSGLSSFEIAVTITAILITAAAFAIFMRRRKSR